MSSFCTVITANYLKYACTLNESLLKFGNYDLNILIVDKEIDTSIVFDIPNIKIYTLNDLCETEISKKIIFKYLDNKLDELRWSLKSVFLIKLLKKYDKVIYLDSDLFFYNDYNFLFDELDNFSVILTPHWRNSNPHINHGKELEHFNHLFFSGLYNAGFIGCNKKSLDALHWWAMVCEYNCEINHERGQYVDQTYLNLFPIYFDKVKILKHRGCNVSEWNLTECRRTINDFGEVNINNQYPIVFIHFVSYLIANIKNGFDDYLIPHLAEWEEILNKYDEKFKNIPSLQRNVNLVSNSANESLLYKIRRKVRIRTRMKRIFRK